jgi:hypothetical protein
MFNTQRPSLTHVFRYAIPHPHLVEEDVSLPPVQRIEPEERKQRRSDFGAVENSRFQPRNPELTYQINN